MLEDCDFSASALLASTDVGAWLQPVDRAFRAAGWTVTIAASPGAIVPALNRPHSLFVVDDAVALATGIRDRDEAAVVLPILGIATTPEPPSPLLDEVIAWPCDNATLRRVAASWHPGTIAATLERLRNALGVGQVNALLASFRALLQEAIADGLPACDLAHRVAGIAGTLGFAEAGRAWLRVSEGDATAAPAALRAARRAVLAIDGALDPAR